jgi:hypothetical protein
MVLDLLTLTLRLISENEMTVINIQDEIRSASRLVMERWLSSSDGICDVIETAYPNMGYVFQQRVIDVCFEDFCKTITSEKGI